MDETMSDNEPDLLAARRAKLDAIRALGHDPFGGRYETSGTVAEARARFAEGNRERLAGRITAHRDMGRSHFLDLRDATGRIQLFVSLKELGGEQAELFKLLDLADFVGVEGEAFTTKTGEPSLKVRSLTFLCKALRPMPSQWYGVEDVELKYRQRYLDLLTSDRSREVFRKRIEIIRLIREFLVGRGFLEVETPMMQAVAGGAAARPFVTRHNALGMELFLRIAPELYLKRLLVGGFDRVFELNRNFRNEGISRRHNPEFTMLEVYQAFGDFETMAELVETLIVHLAEKVCGSTLIEHRDTEGNITRTINLERPWKRARYADLIRGVDPGWFERDLEGKRARCAEIGVEISPAMEEFEITQQVFEKKIEERQVDPLFVTHLPKELVPLAKQNVEDPDLVDAYELVINGYEVSPGYSELNDPIVQRERLEHQAGGESQKVDEEFLLALEHGMPPAGGIGIGIDRLVMLLTGAESIRDVILFPLLKPKQ